MDAHQSDVTPASDPTVQPLGDDDATVIGEGDPAQREWEQTTGTTADREEEIPRRDQPSADHQPETQGEDPVVAELGDEGEGDILPEDL